MSATKKAEIMEKVQASRSPIRQVLRQLDVPKSTYYRSTSRSFRKICAGLCLFPGIYTPFKNQGF